MLDLQALPRIVQGVNGDHVLNLAGEHHGGSSGGAVDVALAIKGTTLRSCPGGTPVTESARRTTSVIFTDQERVEVHGDGEDENLAPIDNKYPEERFYNRTVVIDILAKK